MMNQKGFINIALIIIVVALVSTGAYFALTRYVMRSIPNPTACTQEAMQCPDGSYVGRIGENCEFTKCPSVSPSPILTLAPAPAGKGEKIIRKVGEREGSFLIQKINSNSVDGLWYQSYPVAREEGTDRTLHIGDDIGYACEGVSEKLTNIDFSGQTITFTKIIGKQPAGGCPICLAGKTLIDTPFGAVMVKDMRIGMPIWTTDNSGRRILGVVNKTSRIPVPTTHQMVHLIFDDGRELYVSPGHPTIDGRTVKDLIIGDFYSGARVVTAERVVYNEGATYDILPSGETGFYWANGILLGSTLH